jgi:transcriptional regulator with GAF, ATPase, and Fis domain
VSREPDQKLYEQPEFDHQTVFIPDGQNVKVLVASRLLVVKGSDRGKEFTVRKERVTIGRSQNCDFSLSDRAISGLHAELVTEERGRLVRDLNSKNGILFMGHRVNELFLQSGTHFQVGNDLLRFEPLEEHFEIPISPHNRFGTARGRSVKMREVFAVLEKVSLSTLPVLLLGETGTGKELLASAVHAKSKRKRRPFVVLDCGAVPPKLIESTLFGHEKGAFTGANRTHRGLFEEADGGTLFIDEVGELLPELQPKLLRALEQKEIQRVGGVRAIPVDVRIVAATNRDLRGDLRAMVEDGRFREDLLYRLSVVEVRVPPLRAHPEDIAYLAEHFVEKGNQIRRQHGLPPAKLDADARKMLESYPWPGNVRELSNVLERSLYLAEGKTIGRGELQLDLFGGGKQPFLTANFKDKYKQAKAQLLERFEREYLLNLLRAHGGNLTRAAKQAGLVRHHLRELCRRHGIPAGAESSD